MTFIWPVAVALGSIVALLGVMTLVRRLAEARGWDAEVQRKLIHIATGLFAIALPWLFREDWPVYLLLALTMLVMVVLRLPAFRHVGAAAALHSVERQSWGDFLLALAVALVFLLSARDPLLYVLPLAVVTLSDAAAALAGSTYGKRLFAVEDSHKSVEGSVVFFLVTLILSMVCLLLLSDVSRENVVVLSVLIAAFGTLVEADSWRGFDNLFLPLGVLVILREHGHSPPAELVGVAALFLLALAIYIALAGRLGVSRHIARVHLVASFLLLSITAPQNTVFPLALLVLHALAERWSPSDARHPELDAVAMLAIVSFGWLALGNATGFNALDFFGATTAGVCLALAAVALSNRPLFVQIFAVVALGAVMLPLWDWLMRLNPAEKHWAPHVGTIMATTMLLCAAVPIVMPRAFGRQRMARLTILAAALPLGAFAFLTYSVGATQ